MYIDDSSVSKSNFSETDFFTLGDTNYYSANDLLLDKIKIPVMKIPKSGSHATSYSKT